MRIMVRRDAPGSPLGLLALERIDQIYRGVKAHALAMPRDAGHTRGCVNRTVRMERLKA